MSERLVKFLVQVAAPEGSYSAGSHALIDAQLAERWAELGLLELVSPPGRAGGQPEPSAEAMPRAEPESAELEPTENTAMPRPRRKSAG